MCSGVGLVLSCVFVLLCIFRDLSLSLLNIMKRSSPASFEKKKLSGGATEHLVENPGTHKRCGASRSPT